MGVELENSLIKSSSTIAEKHTRRVKSCGAHVGLYTVLVFAVLAVFTSFVAEHDTTFWGRDR